MKPEATRPQKESLHCPARQRITLHVTQITFMLTLSNQAEIWHVVSYAQNLFLNEISADLDLYLMRYG